MTNKCSRILSDPGSHLGSVRMFCGFFCLRVLVTIRQHAKEVVRISEHHGVLPAICTWHVSLWCHRAGLRSRKTKKTFTPISLPHQRGALSLNRSGFTPSDSGVFCLSLRRWTGLMVGRVIFHYQPDGHKLPRLHLSLATESASHWVAFFYPDSWLDKWCQRRCIS